MSIFVASSPRSARVCTGRSLSLVSTLLLLTACQGSPLAFETSLRSQTAARPVAVTTGVDDAVKASTSTTPVTSPAADANRQPGVTTPTVTPALLTKPSTAVSVLKGNLLVDASALVSSGVGRVISHNGSPIVTGVGNVLSQNGSMVISQNGSQVISQNGSMIIAAGGLNANGLQTFGYGLKQAAGADTGAAGNTINVAPGQQLPAALMALRARSLRDGSPLPLGENAEGQPVYAILTGPDGEYEVYLPDSEAGNILLEAHLPGASGQNWNLLANLRARDEAAFGHVIDEDTAIATRYLRRCLVSRLSDLMRTENTAAVIAAMRDTLPFPPAVLDAVIGVADTYRKAAVESGLAAADKAVIDGIASQLVDNALADLDLSGVKLDNGKSAIEELVGGFATIRELTAARVAAQPGLLATWQFGDTAHFAKGYKPQKPSDVSDFIVEEFLVSSNTDFDTADIDAVLIWAGAQKDSTGASTQARITDGAIALLKDIAMRALSGNTQAIAGWKSGVATGAATP